MCEALSAVCGRMRSLEEDYREATPFLAMLHADHMYLDVQIPGRRDAHAEYQLSEGRAHR